MHLQWVSRDPPNLLPFINPFPTYNRDPQPQLIKLTRKGHVPVDLAATKSCRIKVLLCHQLFIELWHSSVHCSKLNHSLCLQK